MTISGSGSIAGGTITGGTGGSAQRFGGNGGSSGTGMFLHGDGTLTFDLGDAVVYTISDTIADTQGSGGGGGTGSWGLNLDSGTLVLQAANNFTGPTAVNGGTLEVDGSVRTISIGTAGALVGAGSATYLVNSGVIAPGNGTTQVCEPPSNYQFTAENYAQDSGATLDILADPCGGNTQLVVTGSAGLGGILHLDFQGNGPVPGQTFTVLTAGTLIGKFDNDSVTPKSVLGELTYTSNAVLFTVLANDLIFTDGFNGNAATYTGMCMTQAQFADIPATLLQNDPICVQPFTVSDQISGTTAAVCQTAMCTPSVAGCPATLNTAPGTLSGTLAGGYTVATPLSVTSFTAPLQISGVAGNVNCTATLTNTSADLDLNYLASLDYLGDAFVYTFNGAQVNSLNTNVSSSGCGLYGVFINASAPYVIPQIQTSLNTAINSFLLDGGAGPVPGVGDTICPAP